jgi:hypothetical protein
MILLNTRRINYPLLQPVSATTQKARKGLGEANLFVICHQHLQIYFSSHGLREIMSEDYLGFSESKKRHRR